ncbi:hypothetical protein GGI43DRAFT_422229 [Trichoderma evansii]
MSLATRERRRKRKISKPFLDEQPMTGDPQYTKEYFRQPRLRQYVFNPDDIVFESRLGYGADGCVWKVRFGTEGPYVLKVFWDQAPPQSEGHYYALQRECQNNAVLQMVRASIASHPVFVLDEPKGKEEARKNYYSFCKEKSDSRHEHGISKEGQSKLMRRISSLPRMIECYGWLKLHSKMWDNLPSSLKAPDVKIDKIRRYMEDDMEYTALVYEFNNGVADFIYHIGFSFSLSSLAKNWVDSVLLDYADIVYPGGYGWHDMLFGMRDAEDVLWEG